MVEEDTLRMIDGEIQAVAENKYEEILGDMYDTITGEPVEDVQNKNLDILPESRVETSMKTTGAYRYHGNNTQFKQVSLNTTRMHWRRRHKLGTRL